MARVPRSKLRPMEAVAIKAGWTGVAALAFAAMTWGIEDRPSPLAVAALGLGVVLIGIYLSVRWRQVVGAIRSPGTASGANTALFVLAVLGIAVLVNYISARHHYQLDLTRSKKFSLAPVSRNVVRSLKSKVTATAWVAETSYGRINPDYEKARDLLAQYQAVSPKISYTVKDPRRYRDEAIRAGVKTFPVIMLASENGKQTQVTSIEEKDLTLGFIKLVKGSRKKLYFASGHGMPSVTDWGPEGLSRAKEMLESLYHEVETVDLSADQKVPPDCAALILPGPKTSLLPAEEKAISRYLDAGGHVLVLLDPLGPDLGGLLSPWGVAARRDLVLDNRQRFDSPAQLAVTTFDQNHPATKNLQLVLLDGARSLSARSVKGTEVTELLKSSPSSWGETNMKVSPARPDGKDARGPLVLGVAVTKELSGSAVPEADKPVEKKAARLVVIGCSSLPINMYFTALGIENAALFSMLVNWLAEDEMLLDIPPKPAEDTSPVNLTASQRRFVVLVNWLGVSLAVLLAGATVWWRRR